MGRPAPTIADCDCPRHAEGCVHDWQPTLYSPQLDTDDDDE